MTSAEIAKIALEHKNTGNDLFKRKEYAQAVDAYTKAIDADSSQSVFFSNRAFANLKLDRFQSALDDSTKAIELDPSNVKAYHRRGMSYAGLLEFGQAKRDLLVVLRAKPSDATAKQTLALCESMLQRERFERAIRASGSESSEKLCRSLSLSSFAGNTDVNKYEGTRLEIEQVSDDKGKPKGLRVLNMSKEFISHVVKEVFLRGKSLPKVYVAAIVSHAESIFAAEATIVDLNSDEVGGKISVCGDTHGQFYDVLNLFKTFGKVSDDHAYLFNGDFVDRGSWSCEVAILFYCLKILYPKRLFLNRGNHETNNMNKVYGFEDECKYKYSQRIFNLFAESFEALPLGAVINNDYLVIHGGIVSDESVTLDDMKRIDRFHQPPRDGSFMELLWSDPQENDGLGPSQRGLGYAFGPDITAKFLAKNGLKKVIRSHEVRMGGVQFEHNGGLITVFSAPNYCDNQENLGGIVHVCPGKGNKGVLGNDDENLFIETFTAVEHPDIKPMAYSNGGIGF
ncbi:HDL057Cp [Eremothecium sinecaudum]|uniref:Serine/threonine-protein phosphatase n=1 Tax=Eremothecium sinecaudum TaxID=45286 RepID=A0A120K281_9SACH|nr:HDL057Cp [Eremothecium sinecaudum]AMD20687.1 HDL057Cp [Eremothecium sinecaudum]